MRTEHDSDVAGKDEYGNVTAHNQDGQTAEEIIEAAETGKITPGGMFDTLVQNLEDCSRGDLLTQYNRLTGENLTIDDVDW